MAEKQKRKKQPINTKVALTNLFMSVSVIAIVAALTLVAMGYRLDLHNGEIIQYGMVQVLSKPSGARVEIDGERAETTEMNRMLPNGTHEISVTKSGYDVWRGSVDVKSGLLRRIDWVRLFPIERKTEPVQQYKDISFMLASPTRDSIVIGRSGAKWSVLSNLDGGKASAQDIDVPEWLLGREIVESKWNRNGDKLFLKVGEEWGVLDFRNSAGSINITNKFSMKFDDIMVANDAGDKLYGLEGGNLRIIDLRDQSVSDVKVSNVEKIGGEGISVAYIQTVEEKQIIGVYKEGESKGKTLFRPEEEVVAVRAWRYWGEDVVAMEYAGELVVMSGVAYEELDEVVQTTIEDMSEMQVSPSGRFLVTGGKVIDVNTAGVHEVTSGAWLDDFLMHGVEEGRLVVWDFNGGNKRELGEVGGANAMISKGNGWLYFLSVDGSQIMREKL